MPNVSSRITALSVWLLMFIPALVLLPVGAGATIVAVLFGADSPYTTTTQYLVWAVTPLVGYVAFVAWALVTFRVWRRRRSRWITGAMLMPQYAGVFGLAWLLAR